MLHKGRVIKFNTITVFSKINLHVNCSHSYKQSSIYGKINLKIK